MSPRSVKSCIKCKLPSHIESEYGQFYASIKLQSFLLKLKPVIAEQLKQDLLLIKRSENHKNF